MTCSHAYPLREVKAAPLALDLVDEDGTFEGYASVFGKEDLSRDIVMPGAFAQSLERRGAAGVRLLFQHDPAEPIGLWLHLHEDEKGLFVRGRLMRDVARGREVLSLMRAGALDGLSIGFRAVRARKDARTGIRRIDEADLWEISVVTFPMLPDARVSAVKGGAFRGRLPSERELERWLTREAGLTRSTARALLHAGYKGISGMRDAPAPDDLTRLVHSLRRAANAFSS